MSLSTLVKKPFNFLVDEYKEYQRTEAEASRFLKTSIQERDDKWNDWRPKGITGSFQLRTPSRGGCGACALENELSRSVNIQQAPGENGPWPDQEKAAADIYTPIHSWQTRLISLQPGSEGDHLQAELYVADMIIGRGVGLPTLSLEVTYEALSYAWGKPDFCRPLRINGYVYPITENLFRALHRLRHPVDHRFLWIDAICINQHDFSERPRQVRQMLQIYQKAERVLVWLGEYAEQSELVLRCLDLIEPSSPKPQTVRNRKNDPYNQIARLRLCDIHHRDLREGLQDLSQRAWYRRVWVKQEVWAAQAILVHCGGTILKWTQFWKIRGLAKFVDEDRAPETRAEGQETLQHTFEMLLGGVISRNKDIESERESERVYYICDLLTEAVESECSDPRDRIYGLLGMASIPVMDGKATLKDDTCGMTVDYGKSIADVYIDLMEYLLKHNLSLEVMYRRMIRTTFAADLQLPSWVIDWSGPTMLAPWTEMLKPLRMTMQHLHIKPEYIDPSKALQTHGQCRILSLHGHAVGIVAGPVLETHCTKGNLANTNPRKRDPRLSCYCQKCSRERPFPLMIGGFMIGESIIRDRLPHDKMAIVQMRTGHKWPNFAEDQSQFWYDFHLKADPMSSKFSRIYHSEPEDCRPSNRGFEDWEPGYYTPKSFPFKPAKDSVQSLWWVPETTMIGIL